MQRVDARGAVRASLHSPGEPGAFCPIHLGRRGGIALTLHRYYSTSRPIAQYAYPLLDVGPCRPAVRLKAGQTRLGLALREIDTDALEWFGTSLCDMQSCRMARQPRYTSPGVPQHVVQRGNNRIPIFRAVDDHERFLDWIRDASERFGCHVHAYVLMPNHFHLLVTPQESGAIGRTLQSVGRRYVARFNRSQQRTGTLWEGRYRATVIDDDKYLFTCHRYIELNPVRARLVPHPRDYRWSSFRSNALGHIDPLVTPHPRMLALGDTEVARHAAYRGMFRTPLSDEDTNAIRDSTNKAWGLGDGTFLERISSTDRRAVPLLPSENTEWRQARDLRVAALSHRQ